MRIVRASAPARVALAGNPSDGYGGRTLSLAIANHSALVSVRESAGLEIEPADRDRTSFADVGDLVDDVRVNGYYGGMRLLKAAVRRLAERTESLGSDLRRSSFAIGYETDIPRGVGLGGSSAIVVAALTALSEFLALDLERAELAALALEVETDELGIAAGLQDRVAQAYGGLTFMDFDPDLATADGHGSYEQLDPGLLPPLFVAHVASAAEPSEVFHSELRHRYESGEPAVVEAMTTLASLAVDAREAALGGDAGALGRAMDRTFDVRSSFAALDPRHVRLIELARSLGAASNYAGSGGAIVGVHRGEEHLEALTHAFGAEGCALEPCRVASAAAAHS